MVKDCGAVGPTQQCVPLWILLFCHQVSAEVLRENIYFIGGESGILTGPAPPLTNGTEFSWEWTPHHGGLTDIQIATVTMRSQRLTWTLKQRGFWEGNHFAISMYKYFHNAGVYSFKQTQPALALLMQFEIFAVEITSFSEYPMGFDVPGWCEISRLPKSFILQWEKEGDPTANTTLLYNNTAYIIIHSANLQCSGKYICSVRRENGQPLFTTSSKLTVTEYTYRRSSTLYRGSSKSSAVELTCQSSRAYGTAAWSRQQRPAMTPEALVSASKNQAAQTERKTDRERFSFLGFNGQRFPLRIAPLKFEDGGIYTCQLGGYVFAQVTLVNIQVSAEPPGGASRYQPVVLNCMVSEVTETLTLAWLRMEGLRGVLVKQQVLGRSVSARNLSLTLPRLSEDQLHWECAVFGESMLRARVPLHLNLLPEGNNMPMIVAMCVGVVCVGMLTSVLLLYYRRRAAAALAASPGTGNHTHAKFEAVYCEVTDLQGEGDNPNADKAAGSEVLYSAISLGGSSTDQKKRHNPEPDSEGQADVVYSVLRIR
ncbi:uncharacterized protein LOC135240766 isoform X1 [Anguilla rostrata]|uniref:uncharacterized protein LOC135240766 isoform X1 n=1 Tax=Anguilla rostrata TaxID=7938 RepID=UPI0030CB41C0